jgi:hypothetical protein
MVATLKTPLIKLGKMIILVPLFTLVIMGVYSWLFGWNLLTASGAWLILVPLAVFSLSNLVGLRKIRQSGISILCFYAWMVFGTYDHYQSDFFVLMMLSMLYNALIIVLVILSERNRERHTAKDATSHR